MPRNDFVIVDERKPARKSRRSPIFFVKRRIMLIDTQRSVAELALESPQATAVFDKLGIDYCCNGRKPLAEVCRTAGLDVSRVADLLSGAESNGQFEGRGEDWSRQSLAALINHIVGKHHAYCREECVRLGSLMEKVRSKHGSHHPELVRILDEFTALRNELDMHMMKEERMLFPYIISLEESATVKTFPPRAPFGTVQNPVCMMMQEHDDAGHSTKEIRSLAGNFAVPPDACTSFKALYLGLQAFEADLHQHIHLENNLLFPRAIELEETVRPAR
jgi:regulator of cell morphogenesis and NO signaling